MQTTLTEWIFKWIRLSCPSLDTRLKRRTEFELRHLKGIPRVAPKRLPQREEKLLSTGEEALEATNGSA